MKILYIANTRMPTEKAHGIQIMKMCEAFAKEGHEVELVVPIRINSLKSDPFDYYSIPRIFSIKKIIALDLIKFGRIGFIILSITFSLSVFIYGLFKKVDVIFGRDEFPLIPFSFFRKVVWETHTGSYNLSTKLLIKNKPKIIAITQGLKDFYINKGLDHKDFLVSPDAVDVEQFDIGESKEEARIKLGLPKDNKIVLYTGHLYGWKGAHVLAESAKFLPKEVWVVFVGGTEGDIKTFTEKFGELENVHILGKKPHNLMPLYLKSSDVLVLPNSPVNDISNLFTSPMKLFEYMASGRLIVASDLPSIREILTSKHNAVLVPPDEPKLLAEAINEVLLSPELASKISDQSFEDSKKFTWTNRVNCILSFVKER